MVAFLFDFSHRCLSCYDSQLAINVHVKPTASNKDGGVSQRHGATARLGRGSMLDLLLPLRGWKDLALA